VIHHSLRSVQIHLHPSLRVTCADLRPLSLHRPSLLGRASIHPYGKSYLPYFLYVIA
jgi:hypothetical protein